MKSCSPLWLAVVLVCVAVCTVQGCCRVDKKAVAGRKPSCTYNQRSNSITCTGKDGSSHTCSTQTHSTSSEKSERGPVPRGDYLIGLRESGSSSRGTFNWYKLYPGSSYDTYYDYYKSDPDSGRTRMGLLPAMSGWNGIRVTSDACWDRIRIEIDSGESNKRCVYGGVLGSTTIEYIGTLEVI